MNKQIRRISNFSSLPVLLFVLLMQIAVLLVQTAVTLLRKTIHLTLDQTTVSFLAYTLIYVVIGGGVLLIFYLSRGRETGLRLPQVFCKPQQSAGWIWKWFVIIWGLGLLTAMLTNLGLQYLQELLHFQMRQPDFDSNFGSGVAGTLVMLLALSIYAPVMEELIFRSAVYRHTEIMGQGFAILFSAAMFGLMHGNLTQLFYTFVMGMGLAYLFAKTRSLFVPMLLHFCINTFSALSSVLLRADADDPEKLVQSLLDGNMMKILGIAGYAMIIYGLIIAAVVLGIIELVRAIRRRERLQGGIFPISGVKKTLVFLSAPVTVITLVVLLGILVLNTLESIH
ncbi:MAG: CPBP family intramembrane metalloprotease [Ruminococcus sp.]|nr:CPBP family intramembrane metalloprotease [Ruminococcus sp.]